MCRIVKNSLSYQKILTKGGSEMKTRIILVQLLIVLGSGLFFTNFAEPAEKPIELSLSLPEAETGVMWQRGLKPWIDEISKRTGERIKVVPYFNSSLVPFTEHYKAVEAGICDLALTDSNTLPGMFPMQEIWSQILPSTPYSRWGRIHWEIFNKFPEYMKEMPPIKILFTFSYGPATIGMTKKPIRSLEDAKGTKLMLIGKVSTDAAEALGFAPIPTWPAEFFTTIEKGVADGTLLCRQTFFHEYSLAPYIKYITDIHIANTPFFMSMNMKKWNSFPPDIKKVFDELGGEWAADYFDKLYYQTTRVEGPARMKEKYGTQIIKLSPEELNRWDQRIRPLTDSFLNNLEAKGLPAKKVFDEYNRLVQKYKVE
jgi:TRAP-type C4-dicarboxylate transport system substrate-binding protein